MLISSIIQAIEQMAPLSYQEKWDNSGLQIGNAAVDCTGVLVCLDPTPAVVEEAVALGCNLIVSHHPLFFKPIKKLTGATPVQVTALNAIAAGIAIYSTHTAIDSAPGGVSHTLATKLGVKPLRPLDRLADRLVHLEVIAPVSHADLVRAALFDAGAGSLGDYDCCSFNVKGTGTFRALDGAEPFVGEIAEHHREEEVSISVVCATDAVESVEKALLDVHPYQTPAYTFTPMLNKLTDAGLGVYGTTDQGLTVEEFIQNIMIKLGCTALRCTKPAFPEDTIIRRVAVCGGAGGEYIPKAIAAGAQVYVTADVKYHDFVDYNNTILVVDAGHYETEAPIKEVIAALISDKFPQLPVKVTRTDDNPVSYRF